MADRLLVIDDDRRFLEHVADFLKEAGYEVDTLANPRKAREAIRKGAYQGVLLDLVMPGISGLEVLEVLREEAPSVPVIMISGEGTVDRAVKALKHGAYDFVEKPIEPDYLLHVVKRMLDHHRLEQSQAFLMEELLRQYPIIAESTHMKEVLAWVEHIAPLDIPVLLTGETGTGKGLIARVIHYKSQRRDKPFVTVNCAAIPGELMESVLFGHAQGAFTGAVKPQKGKFLLAHGGTIFLDEIAELSPAMQAKLLHVLQEGEVDVLGEEQPRKVDVRVIAATNRPLEELLHLEGLRPDLYHRLAGVHIHLCPLRERREDILPIAYHTLREEAERLGKPVQRFHPRVEELLEQSGWPGNVRELQHVVERLVVFAQGSEITPGDYYRAIAPTSPRSHPLPPAVPSIPPVLPLRDVLEDVERTYLNRVLEYTEGDIGRAATLLGVDRSNLYRKLRRYGLRRSERV